MQTAHHQGKKSPVSAVGTLPAILITIHVKMTAGNVVMVVKRNISTKYELSIVFLLIPISLQTVNSSVLSATMLFVTKNIITSEAHPNTVRKANASDAPAL